MSRLPRNLYRQAIMQARANGTLPDRNRREITDRAEATNVRTNRNDNLIRKTKRKLRSKKRSEIWERYWAGEDISRISYSYEAGDLVMNTRISHGKRTPESCGLIVETDTDRHTGTARILSVMSSEGLVQWDAARCIPVPPDDE